MSVPISILTDFGYDDEFVGVVHGVIARISPSVRVLDITHGIGRGDIHGGAMALTRAVQFMPEGVFLAVVDPETGERRDVATSSSRLRRRYAEAAAEQRTEIAANIRSAGADHLVLRTDRDWLYDMVRFVALRRDRTQSLARPRP